MYNHFDKRASHDQRSNIAIDGLIEPKMPIIFLDMLKQITSKARHDGRNIFFKTIM